MDNLQLLDSNRRQWNARPALVGDGTEFHVGEVNSLDSSYNWKEIDLIMRQGVGGFETGNSTIDVLAPLRAQDICLVNVNRRFDLFPNFSGEEKTIITADPLEIRITPVGVNNVAGQLFDIYGSGRLDSVMYKDAYTTDFRGNLVYYAEHGRAARVRKLIMFTEAPTKDIAVQFLCEYNTAVELSPRRLVDGKSRAQTQAEWAARMQSVSRDKLYISNGGGLYCRTSDPKKRGSGIPLPTMWDSNPSIFGPKTQYIDTYIEWVTGNKYRITKIIPKSFFDEVVFPVYTDATYTGNPDAHPETNTTDGYIRNADGTWDAMHDRYPSDAVVDDVGISGLWIISNNSGANTGNIGRGCAYFDTSSIPSGSGITSATFSGYSNVTSDDDDDGNDYIVVVQVQGNNIVSDTSLHINDIDKVGDSVDTPTEGSSQLDLTGKTTGLYYDFVMDATGRSWIARNGEQKPSGGTAGITYLGLREGHDVQDDPVASLAVCRMYFNASEIAGIDQDPKLVIEYTTAAGNPWYHHRHQEQN